MAEALAVIGLVTNIATLIDYGQKAVKRLHEFQTQAKDVPKTFRDIKTELPLLLDTLNETKDQAEANILQEKTQKVLIPVVDGCRSQVQELQDILDKMLPTPTDYSWQVRKKALGSVHQEKKVKKIFEQLQRYVQILTYHQVTRIASLDPTAAPTFTRSRSPSPVPGARTHSLDPNAPTLTLTESRSRSPGPQAGTATLHLSAATITRSRSQSPRPRSRSPGGHARTGIGIPFDRDNGYVDRGGIMLELGDKLNNHRKCALAGIGGVGKSQIAVEYCYRYYESSPDANVFWIHAATLSQFELGYKQIAKRMNLPGWDGLDQNTFETVHDWLSDEDSGPWLMVLDSADDIDMFFPKAPKNAGEKPPTQLARYIPQSPDGTLLVTTRDKRVAGRLTDRQKPIDVPPMHNTEAQQLLRSKLPEDMLIDSAEASELVDALGNLPLAISQAAAFITENSMEVGEYLAALNSDVSQMQDLLSEDLGDHRRHPDSESAILSTWKMSFNQITKQKSRAADILSLMAVLERNAIPKSILTGVEERAMDFASALGVLQAFSLIVAEKDGKFALHRLVQLSTQKWLELQGTLTKWQETALDVIYSHFPLGEYENWKQCEALSTHAQVVVSYSYDSDECLIKRANVLHNLARFDDQQSRYTRAEARYEEVIALRRRLLGSKSLDTLQSICFYGLTLYREAKYPESEDLLREALAGTEGILGPTHPDVIMNVGHLAEAVRASARFEEAESLYRRALAGKEDDLGKDFIAMKNADNLGSVLRDVARLEEAEVWVRRAFEAREKTTGPESFPTIGSVSHLAIVMRLQGKLDGAQELNERALAGFEKLLGREHFSTLRSLDDLSAVYRCQGKIEEAEEQNRRALRGLEKVLGVAHRRTISSKKHLALILKMTGRLEEAEKLVSEVLETLEWQVRRDADKVTEIAQLIEGLEDDVGRLNVARD